jgi:chromosomal replication initiation ATPase DnaA
MPPRQIPLELPAGRAQARDDLIIGASNALAVDLIDAWPDWPGNVVILAGPTGSGKSHLASVWAENARAEIFPMSGLNLAAMPASDCLVLEDAQAGAIDETALFAVLNHARTQGGSCIVTSRSFPQAWGICLADLNSRLRAAQLVELGEPDDLLLRQVIVKLFADRQLNVSPRLVDYLAARMERSLGAANALVDEIDREALSRKGPVTRQVAASALARLSMG